MEKLGAIYTLFVNSYQVPGIIIPNLIFSARPFTTTVWSLRNRQEFQAFTYSYLFAIVYVFSYLFYFSPLSFLFTKKCNLKTKMEVQLGLTVVVPPYTICTKTDKVMHYLHLHTKWNPTIYKPQNFAHTPPHTHTSSHTHDKKALTLRYKG